MKINHLTTLFAILATMLFAVACGEEAATETTEPTAATEPAADEATEEVAEAEPAAAEAEAEPAGEAEPAAAGGGSCDRAQRCCEAYVNEMSAMGTAGISVEQTCASIAALRASPTGAASCDQMIAGWRTGLETAQRTVPADCAAE